jgi:hypothetical protein
MDSPAPGSGPGALEVPSRPQLNKTEVRMSKLRGVIQKFGTRIGKIYYTRKRIRNRGNYIYADGGFLQHMYLSLFRGYTVHRMIDKRCMTKIIKRRMVQ